jgi:hypothetical protein
MKLLYGQHPERLNQLTSTTEGLANLEFRGGVYKFYGIDSEADFKERLKTMPGIHPWRKWQNVEINYTLNEQCYRAPSWDKIDWSKSIILFGCSQTFGIGIDDKQTISHHVENSIGIPVINLGVAGSSNMFQWINTTLLRQHGISPLAVVYNWTFAHRVSVLERDFRTLNSGIWNIEAEPLVKGWNYHENHSTEFLRYLILSTEQQWQPIACPVLNYTVCRDSANAIDSLTFLDRTGDLARDHRHLGPGRAKEWADIICNKLKTVL